jgi:hypothetical protein
MGHKDNLHKKKGEVRLNMSIGLRITYRDPNKEGRRIPIAHQETFENYWRPIALKLGLRHILLFDTGYPILKLDSETIPAVINELLQLNTAVSEANESQIPQGEAEDIKLRIRGLISELKYALDNPDEVAYVRV